MKMPWNFLLISLLAVCPEWWVKNGDLKAVRVSYVRLAGQYYPLCHGSCCYTLRKIPWNFLVYTFIRSMSGIGGQEGWRTLSILDWRLGRQGHPWCPGWCCLTLSKKSWKFRIDIFMRRMSGMGVKNGGIWRMLTVPDQRLGGHGRQWHDGYTWKTPRITSSKFCVIIFIFGRNVSKCLPGSTSSSSSRVVERERERDVIIGLDLASKLLLMLGLQWKWGWLGLHNNEECWCIFLRNRVRCISFIFKATGNGFLG